MRLTIFTIAATVLAISQASHAAEANPDQAPNAFLECVQRLQATYTDPQYNGAITQQCTRNVGATWIDEEILGY